MDANFGLVHKSNAGKSYEGAKHPWKCFLENAEVENFVKKHEESSKSQNKPTVRT